MSDAEWQVIEPTLPPPAWKAGKGGRPAEHCRRDIVDAIRYLVKEGIQWRAMPCDFPPFRTVYDVLDRWEKSGATEMVHDELRRQCRIAAGRRPEPTAAIIDSQSVKAAETVSKAQPRLRCGQEDQWPQAAHRRGHHRAAADRAGHRRRRPGPRRSQAAAVEPAQGVPHRQAGLGRLRLRREAGDLGEDLRSGSSSRSSGAPSCTSSSCCRAAGWWNGPSPGSPGHAVQSETTSDSPPTTRPSSTGR